MNILLMSCVLNYRTLDGILSKHRIYYLISAKEKELLEREISRLEYKENLIPIYLLSPVLASSLFKSFETLGNEKIDLLMTTSPLRGLICLLHKKLSGKPYAIFVGQSFTELIEIDGPLYMRLLLPFYRLAMRVSFGGAAAVITHSRHLREYVKRHGARRVEGIYYYGVNTGVFKPAAARKNDAFTIFCASRFIAQKGATYLLDACRILKKKNVPYKLEWYSEGPLKQPFMEAAGKEGLPIGFHDYVDEKTLAERISEADVFVMPSLSEGLGFAAAEALSCEKPVVATNVGGLPDVVEGYGILVPPRSGDALAEALLKVHGNLPYYRERAAAGRRHIIENFDRKLVVKQFLDALERARSQG
ncbi:MAG: glycosyltransferase family 4 protein [Candidatus Altiarchaeota archaeon]|nr:glycosyltransferase family 4 protein [Candidatus Altiarchaeota archaeon]